MRFISALADYMEYKKIVAKSFQEEIDLGCNRTIHSVFFDENETLCIGIEDCGYLFSEEVDDNYAEMIIDHLLETEGIFIPVDE